jgi:hypothetical protein
VSAAPTSGWCGCADVGGRLRRRGAGAAAPTRGAVSATSGGGGAEWRALFPEPLGGQRRQKGRALFRRTWRWLRLVVTARSS